MPIQFCEVDGKPGKRWGQNGKCFTGPDAEKKAAAQGVAIEASIRRKKKALNKRKKKGVYNELTQNRRSLGTSRRGLLSPPSLNQACLRKLSSLVISEASMVEGNTGIQNQRQRKGNRVQSTPGNPLTADPTRTITLRRKFVEDLNRRFERVKRRMRRLIIDQDAFGLTRNEEQSNESRTYYSDRETAGGLSREGSGSFNSKLVKNKEQENVRRFSDGRVTESQQETRYINGTGQRASGNSYVQNQRFSFPRRSQQVRAFNQWLQRELQLNILGVTAQEIEDAYWRQYVEEGYRKGAGRAFDQVRKPALAFEPGAGVSDFYAGTKDEFLRSAFGRPVAIERVKQLAGRVFHGPPGVGLRGVTQEMAERMSQTLTDGLVQGKNPREIARDLAKAIDVGKKRAEMIARTEVIRAHAEGQLDVMERLGVEEVGVMVEWSTAGDDRVCPMCQPLEGIVMKIREARGTLPRHPLCRCSYIPANVGEPKGEKREVDFTDPDTGEIRRQEVGQTRTAKQLREARDQSIRGEFRGRKDPGTLADMRKRSRWTGADRRFAKVRPQSVLDKPPKKLKPTADDDVNRMVEKALDMNRRVSEDLTFKEINEFITEMKSLPVEAQIRILERQHLARTGKKFPGKVRTGKEARRETKLWLDNRLERFQRQASVAEANVTERTRAIREKFERELTKE